MTNTKKERVRVEIRTTEKEKKFLKNKAEKLGYTSLTAFLISAAENHFLVELDLSFYREVSKEINYVGKNINSLIRRINTDGIYSQSDVLYLSEKLSEIKDIVSKDYQSLIKLRKKYESDKMPIKEKKNLIKALQQNEIRIPKKVALEEIYNSIKNDMIYLSELIVNSPELDETFVDYLWQYLYGETLYNLADDKLIDLSDKIFIFTQKIKMKLLNLDNIFDEDDWDNLKEILDEYEIY